MSNNTTATNLTGDNMSAAEVVDESGILDTLTDSPELMLCAAVIAALAAYIAYTQPAIRVLVMPYVNKFLKTHEAKIDALLEENLHQRHKR